METEVPEVKLREFFNKLTASSGGKLSLEGFLKLNYQLYLNRTEAEAKKQFSRLDKDASDSLDFDEVKTLLRENWVLLPERRKELRAQLDKFSDDEYLDMDLLSNILTKFGSDPIDEDNASTFISDLDWNADGRISKDELTVFLLKGHEWDSEKGMEGINGDESEDEDVTGDIEDTMDERVKEEEDEEEDEEDEEDEPLQDEGLFMDEKEKTQRKGKSKHGKEPSHRKDLSQEESSSSSSDDDDDNDDNDASQAEKISEDDKATRKAEKEAKKEARNEAKRARKAAKKAKKDDKASNKSADDPDAEENET